MNQQEYIVEVCDRTIDIGNPQHCVVHESLPTAQAAADRAKKLRSQYEGVNFSVAYQVDGTDILGPRLRWVHTIQQSLTPEMRAMLRTPPSPQATPKEPRASDLFFDPSPGELPSKVRLEHTIDQLEAELASLCGRGTSCMLIDRLRWRTEDRGGQLAQVSGLLSSTRQVLVEGDVIEIDGEPPRLVLVYGSYIDTSAHFGGIGWHFRYLEGEYEGDFHSSPASWYIEGLVVRGHVPPLRLPDSPALKLSNARYELADGLTEGTRVTWPLRYAKSSREGILCFGLYEGNGYGSRETSAVVWYVKFDDSHCEPVQYVADITPIAAPRANGN